jgi:hypothetical protein
MTRRHLRCRRGTHLRGVLGAVAVLTLLAQSQTSRVVACPPMSSSTAAWHFAANGNFSASEEFLPAALGFNLADVSPKSELESLPFGVKGLVYLGSCRPVDAAFEAAVAPYVGDPKLFGFYLIDDPDPATCAASSLAGESDYIHTHLPGALTFILEQNLSSSQAPSFDPAYSPADTGIDLFGISPYPCRSELNGCDYSMVSRYVAAAESAGIPTADIVPVFQAFGSGAWVDDGGGSYLLPTAREASQIFAEWAREIPSPVFDYVYSWGTQRGDHALATGAADVQSVFAAHNAVKLRCCTACW